MQKEIPSIDTVKKVEAKATGKSKEFLKLSDANSSKAGSPYSVLGSKETYSKEWKDATTSQGSGSTIKDVVVKRGDKLIYYKNGIEQKTEELSTK